MFTKRRWNVLNIQWHPVDNPTAVMTTLTRSSLCYNALPFVSLTRPPCIHDASGQRDAAEQIAADRLPVSQRKYTDRIW